MIEEDPNPSSVLGRDPVYLAQDFQSPQRDVAQITDRRSNNIEHDRSKTFRKKGGYLFGAILGGDWDRLSFLGGQVRPYEEI